MSQSSTNIPVEYINYVPKPYKVAGRVEHEEIAISVAYLCPGHNCGWRHWISPVNYLREGFEISCDCGAVFKPKPPSETKPPNSRSPKTPPSINEEILKEVIETLKSYGFDKNKIINTIRSVGLKDSLEKSIPHIIEHYEMD